MFNNVIEERKKQKAYWKRGHLIEHLEWQVQTITRHFLIFEP
jgi:hypothetical protein